VVAVIPPKGDTAQRYPPFRGRKCALCMTNDFNDLLAAHWLGRPAGVR
jgi:hypothetical protein